MCGSHNCCFVIFTNDSCSTEHFVAANSPSLFCPLLWNLEENSGLWSKLGNCG